MSLGSPILLPLPKVSHKWGKVRVSASLLLHPSIHGPPYVRGEQPAGSRRKTCSFLSILFILHVTHLRTSIALFVFLIWCDS